MLDQDRMAPSFRGGKFKFPKRIKRYIGRFKKDYTEYKQYISPVKRANKNSVFMVLTPVHGNLGDHAIAFSELEVLKSLGYEVCEITGKHLFYLESHNQLSLMNHKPILITGGGFLGTLWYHDERVVRNTILANPDSPILLFPNTVYYENSEWGQLEFEKAKSIYSSHKNLKMFAREKTSFEVMKQLCNNVFLAPDMVMRLKINLCLGERKGCLLCLRSDKEKTLSDEMTSVVKQETCRLFNSVVSIDTVLPYGIPLNDRNVELEKIFKRFGTAELVITDRLHGMIFCAITGTPCIVLNSRSPKVLGCYEWLSHLPYIKVCSDPSKISEIYGAIPHGTQNYENSEILRAYTGLLEKLNNLGGKNGQ